MAELDASLLHTTVTDKPGQLPPAESLVFGQTFTDHMLQCKWSAARGWEPPVIKPYGDLSISPAASVLHYSTTLFEGMKAYKDRNGCARLFRPDMNMKRMNNGMQRMAFPTIDAEVLTELIKKLVKLDEHWIPTEEGCSLYIRPTAIGTRAGLGVGPSSELLLFVIMSPVGRYYASGAKPISLQASTKEVRAWPGGAGAYKFGSNYGPCINPQLKAAAAGFQQILWLLPTASGEEQLLEVGMMNLFVAIKRPAGPQYGDEDYIELLTPSLEDGLILPGVTRDSVLALARAHADPSLSLRLDGVPDRLVVTERTMYMREILDAARDGLLVEVFGTGTAAVVSAVERIGHEVAGDVKVPVSGLDGMGLIAGAMMREIVGRQTGEIESDWSVVVA